MAWGLPSSLARAVSGGEPVVGPGGPCASSCSEVPGEGALWGTAADVACDSAGILQLAPPGGSREAAASRAQFHALEGATPNTELPSSVQPVDTPPCSPRLCGSDGSAPARKCGTAGILQLVPPRGSREAAASRALIHAVEGATPNTELPPSVQPVVTPPCSSRLCGSDGSATAR